MPHGAPRVAQAAHTRGDPHARGPGLDTVTTTTSHMERPVVPARQYTGLRPECTGDALHPRSQSGGVNQALNLTAWLPTMLEGYRREPT